ncbi:MAG: hypothetical protein E7332_05415 [Clostridiales bacterium]|nr:hypothetical protein [Clostridiales bacterium]
MTFGRSSSADLKPYSLVYNMKNKTICLILAVVLFLCSCSSIKENDYIGDLPALTVGSVIEEGSPQIIKPSLYYLDPQTNKLVVEARSLIVPKNMAVEEVIMETLLAGPTQSSLEIPCEDYKLDKVEKSGSLINVYISGKELNEREMFFSSCCIADSMIEYCNVSYVSVFFNGFVFGINGYPCGPFTKTDVDVESLYQEYIARYPANQEGSESKNITLDTPLYFITESGEFILTEVRSVTYNIDSFVTDILYQLAQGPKYNFNIYGFLTSDMKWMNDMESSIDAENHLLILRFETNPFRRTGAPSKQEMSAIYYTLCGMLPNVDAVILDIGTSGMVYLNKSNTAGNLGQNLRIYTPYYDFTTISPVNVTISSESAHQITKRIAALINRNNSSFGFPVSDKDLVSARIEGSICIVDLSSEFYEKLSKFSDARISVVLQSIVNTAAEDSRIKTVLFLSDGARIQNYGENLSLFYPLFPNIGIIS